MLTGEVPTPAVMRVVNDVRTPLAAAGASAFPGVGAKFLAAIDWTAAVAPKDRPQSVEALREALGAGPTSIAAPVGAARAKRPGRRLLVALALAAFGALGVGAWMRIEPAAMPDAGGPPSPRVAAPAPIAVPRSAPAPIAAAALEPLAAQATPASAPIAATAAPAMASAPTTVAEAAPAHRPGPPRRPAVAALAVPATAPKPLGTESSAGSHGPAEICSGRNFIARAFCISRQCQAAGSHIYPECVEARRREEQRLRRMDR